MTVPVLSESELRRRAASLFDTRSPEEPAVDVGAAGSSPSFHLPPFIQPLSKAADSLLEVLDGKAGTYRLGLPAIDLITRGFGPGDLVLLEGFSFSGKSQVLLSSFTRNLDKRILFLSLDDSVEMVLRNLVCMVEDLSYDDFEGWVRDHQAEARKLLHDHANKTFANLRVHDESCGMEDLPKLVEAAEEDLGGPLDLLAIDYLQSLRTFEAVDVRSTALSLKRFCKGAAFPVIAIHQGTRSGAKPGDEIGLLSGAYAGEQEASVILGVFRKRDREGLTQEEQKFHKHTISISVPKNKRTAKRTPPDGEDFTMLPSGKVVSMHAAEFHEAKAEGSQEAAFDATPYEEEF